MATFTDIQNRVTTAVIDLPAAVNSAVPNLINAAMRKLQSRHNFKVMETLTASLLTTIAVRTLAAVPTNFKEIRGTSYMLRDDGSTRDLIYAANREAILDAFPSNDPNDKGEPQAILDAEPNDANVRNFEVWPFPDGLSDFTGGEYRIVIPYWRFVAALAAGTDTNWFTVNAEDYLVYKATADAFALDWDEEHEAIWLAKSNNEFNDTKMQDKRFRLAGVRTLVPHKDVFAIKLRT